MMRCFPEATLYTSVYSERDTFAEFAGFDVRTTDLDRFTALRSDPRRALPFLATAFRHLDLSAYDRVLCSSSGFAHCVNHNAKYVYCYNPPRWLYQSDEYLLGAGAAAKLAVRLLRSRLVRADRRAAAQAAGYAGISNVVVRRIRREYGRESTLIHPPVLVDCDGPQEQVSLPFDSFLLTVARPRGYKNVSLLEEAVAGTEHRLVVVGGDPRQVSASTESCRVGRVSEASLRWLYSRASALVTVSREDFGLTPIEANGFGTPALVLRAGGFLDTLEVGVSGLFIDAPATLDGIRACMDASASREWDEAAIRQHAKNFSEDGFHAQLHKFLEVDR